MPASGGSSDGSDWLTAIVGAIGTIFGTTGSTSGNTSGMTDSTSNTTGTATTTSKSTNSIEQLISSLFSNTSLTSSKSSQQNDSTTGNTSSTTSSPEAIATEQGIVNDAAFKSNDLGITDNLVSGILKKSALAFAPTESLPNQSGIYNSTSLGLLKGNAQAQATADSAAAVLQYRTNEQSIAQAGAQQLLDATKNTTGTSTTSGTSTGTTTGSTVASGESSQKTTGLNTTDLQSVVQNIINTLTHATTASKSDQTVNTPSISLICTELYRQGKMDRKTYLAGARTLANYPLWGILGYQMWAKGCVSHLRANPHSTFSRFLRWLFTARNNGNLLARFLVTTFSAACGLYILANNKDVELTWQT